MNMPHPWRGIRPWKRHSLVLMVAGLVYAFVGLSYILAPLTPSREQSLGIALDWWSIDWWGAIFIFSGLLSILSSRWPPVSETWGYTVLTGLSTGWGCFYLTGVLMNGAAWTNVSGFFAWGLLGFLWWAISGLVNPVELKLLDPDTPEGQNGRNERS